MPPAIERQIMTVASAVTNDLGRNSISNPRLKMAVPMASPAISKILFVSFFIFVSFKKY